MTPFLKKYSVITLVLFASLAGIIWRIEVEYHGWKGLIWLSYFHKAIPIAFGLFLIWTNMSIQLSPKRRFGLNLVAIILAFGVLYALELSFARRFISGPAAMFYMMGDDPLKPMIFFPDLLTILLPITIALLSRIFGIVCNIWFVVLSAIVMMFSPYICIELLDIFDEKGYPDYIHTIKTGYLMSAWFFSIGLVFILHKTKQHAISPKENPELLDDVKG